MTLIFSDGEGTFSITKQKARNQRVTMAPKVLLTMLPTAMQALMRGDIVH